MTVETPAPSAALPILSHWIGGRPIEVPLDATGPLYNPATGNVIARVPRGGAAEVDAAAQQAAAAFPALRATWMSSRSEHRSVPAGYLSFGGTKLSAFGDLATRGEDGVRFFTQQEMVTERWPEPGKQGPLSLVCPDNS